MENSSGSSAPAKVKELQTAGVENPSGYRVNQRSFNKGRGRGSYPQGRGGYNYHSPSQGANFGNNGYLRPLGSQYSQQTMYSPQFHPPVYAQQIPVQSINQFSTVSAHPYQMNIQNQFSAVPYYQQFKQPVPSYSLDQQQMVAPIMSYSQNDVIHKQVDQNVTAPVIPNQHFSAQVQQQTGFAYSSDLPYGHSYEMNQHSFYPLPVIQVPQYPPAAYPQQPHKKPNHEKILENVESHFAQIDVAGNERLYYAIDSEGFAPLLLVLGLPRVQGLVNDLVFLKKVLSQSQSLELGEDGFKVRSKKDWKSWVQKSAEVKIAAEEAEKARIAAKIARVDKEMSPKTAIEFEVLDKDAFSKEK